MSKTKKLHVPRRTENQMKIKWKYECRTCGISIIGEQNAEESKYNLAVARHKKSHDVSKHDPEE